MTAFGWILSLLSLTLVTSIGSLLDLQEFLKRNPSIEEMENLKDFKEMVRRQMYLSLVQMLFLWTVFFVALYAFITRQMGTTRVVIFAVMGLAIFFAARAVRGLREQARSLPAADKGLEGLYTAVGQIWQRKHLPDF